MPDASAALPRFESSRHRLLVSIVVAAAALLVTSQSWAGTCTWKGTSTATDFNTGGNWSCGRVPGTFGFGVTDSIVFDGTTANADCTMSASATSSITTVTFQNGYSKTFSANGKNLTISGAWTQPSGAFSSGTGTISIGSTLTVSGGTFSGGGGSISVSGAITVSGGTLSPASSNISAPGVTVSSGAFTGGSGGVTINGNLSITGGTFTASSTTTTVSGNYSNAGTFSANTGTLSLTGTSSSGTITSGGFSFNALIINGSGGTYTLQDALATSGTLTVTAGTLATGSKSVTLGGLTINGGTFTAPTGTMTLSGAFNKTSGTFTAPTGSTVYFSGTGTLSHTFGGASFANVQVGQGTSGMVGYWKLDETSGTTAADSSGTGNTGTYNSSGVTHPSTVSSSIAFSDPAAVTLNGSTGYVTLGTTSFPVNNAPQSISLWFQGTAVSGTNQNMIALVNINGSSAIQLGFRDTNLVLWSYGGTALVSTAAPTDAAWHQVIYTYDGVTDSLYLDGVLKSYSTVATHQTSAPATAYLGTYNPNAEMWNGSLDDVRVYNRALTAGEVSLLASGASPTTVSGTHTFSDAFACTGDFTILAGTVTGSSTFAVAGDWFNAGTFSSTGQVTLSGTSTTATITSGGSSLGALTLSGSGTYTINDNLSITRDLKVSAGTLAGTKNLTVGGSFTNAGTYAVTGRLTLTSTSTTAKITSGGARLPSLTINGSGGKYTLQDRLWVPAGTITLTAGTLDDGGQVIHAGAFSIGSGSYSPNSGKIILDGTTDTTFSLPSLATLRIEDPIETSLVGYWKLDEATGTSLKDSSGNGNTGTLASSGVTWNTSSGPTGVKFDDYAYTTLNGTSGYASVGVTNMPATNAAITISAWVNVTSASGNQNIVALSGSGNLLQFGIRGGSYVVWPSGAATSVTGPTVATGGWHHVAYTYDGSSTDTIYVDGTAYAGSFTHQSGATTAAYIGTFNGSSEFFNGAVDDVRIYSVALPAKQITELAAGRYAGTGGGATVTLGASTSLAGALALDNGNLSASGRTVAVGTTADVNSGTYSVGTGAQTFNGALTVNAYGALTLASNGGSVKMASGQTLTVDGTLNASSTSATIQSVSGTYTFKVGSTSSATPTLNISGLAVKNTSGGMQIGASTSATTTFTEFDNVRFSGGSGTQYLLINAKSLYLSSNGCTFDAGQTTGGTTRAITIAGNGTSDGETRAIFGTTTCAANWYVSATNTSCGTGAKSDDDSDNDGVGNTPATNGAVAQFIRAAGTDTAGSVIGFPTPAFDWNTFSYYSTYAAFHNASGGTSDVIYVRDESGNALYSWTVPTAGESITGTPQWNSVTVGAVTTHYLYVATTQGHVYRLVDTGTGTTSGSLSLDTAWTTNPYDCSCTITTPLSLDASNLYWGSTTSGKNFWTLGQSTESSPTPVSITQTVTTSGMTLATLSGTTYAYMGVTGAFLKISTVGNALTATNSSPGTINGRVAAGYNKTGSWRLFGGDNNGKLWAVDPGSSFSGTPLWSYTATSSISGSPYYDHDTDTVQFGTDSGAILSLDASTGAVVVGGASGYPYTPSSGDAITASPLYYSGILVIGSTGGKLYFLDRNNGSGRTLLKQYYFGANEAVSGIGYDVNVDRFMVTTASAANKDGKLYYFDLITDPTSGSK